MIPKKLLAPLLALLPACAFLGGRGEATDPMPIAIQVENNLIPSTTVRVTAVSNTGQRSVLGSVLPGGRPVFTYTPASNTSNYQLIADAPGPGGVIASRPIIAGSGDAIEWELPSNIVIVR